MEMQEFTKSEIVNSICDYRQLSSDENPEIQRRVKHLLSGPVGSVGPCGFGVPTTEYAHGKLVYYDAATVIKCAVALNLEDQGFRRSKLLKMARAWNGCPSVALEGSPQTIGDYFPPRSIDLAIHDAQNGGPEWFLMNITRRFSGEIEPYQISTFVRDGQTFTDEDPFNESGDLSLGNVTDKGEVLHVEKTLHPVTSLIQSFLPAIYKA